MWRISDLRYLKGDKEGTKTEGEGAEKPNLQLRASKRLSRPDFRKQKLLHMNAIGKEKVEEELFVNYG